ncbi:2OG-Fe(II) oxygenase family protein [Candidatus Pelagibacter sp.]|nr:2OG-Fe(II) oxygenase family protein [Candidatus Pelagibacter sp.]
MNLINLFPLTIIKDKIEISEEDKNVMINEIRDMKKNSKNLRYQTETNAWTGDTQGFEFIHKNKKFKKLFDEIIKRVWGYLNCVEIDSKLVDIYIQRSWATISIGNERIKKHRHFQSHISFAYYLKKNKQDSNFVVFDESYKNEIMPGIFRSDTALQKGIVKKMNQFNVTQAIVNVEENDIVIFPSKTIHSTQPTQNNDERISISADIVCIAKDSNLLEMGMPPLNQWTKM